MVFTEKKNITRTEWLVQAANEAGLDAGQFKFDYEHEARQLFEEDLSMAREWNVRGFPTLFFIDEDDNRFKVYGSKPYQVYEQALLKVVPVEAIKNTPSSYETIFKSFDTVTLKEFAVFYDKTLEEAEAILNELEQQKKIKLMASKAGPLWKVTN